MNSVWNSIICWITATAVAAVVASSSAMVSHAVRNMLRKTGNCCCGDCCYSRNVRTIYRYPWIHGEANCYASSFRWAWLSAWIVSICDNRFGVLRWCPWRIVQGSHCTRGMSQLVSLKCLLRWIRMLRLWNRTADNLSSWLIALWTIQSLHGGVSVRGCDTPSCESAWDNSQSCYLGWCSGITREQRTRSLAAKRNPSCALLIVFELMDLSWRKHLFFSSSSNAQMLRGTDTCSRFSRSKVFVIIKG